VKGAAAHACDELPSPPDAIRRLRRRLGIDDGKLDYVMRDGETVLLDVNRTPAVSTLERFGITRKVARHLARALYSL
jgi:hypothetical protein